MDKSPTKAFQVENPELEYPVKQFEPNQKNRCKT